MGKTDKWRKGTNYKKYRESAYWKRKEKSDTNLAKKGETINEDVDAEKRELQIKKPKIQGKGTFDEG